MGVAYDPVLMVGKEFDDPSEVADFLRKHGVTLPDEDSPEMEDGLGEVLYGGDLAHGLTWERQNYYTSWEGGFLGWSPNVREPDKFADEVRKMQQRWADLFGEPAALIHAVKVW